VSTIGLPDLASIDSAEALFEALGVPYDAHVLAVARLHVLRRFGRSCAAIDADAGLSAAERRERLRAAIAEAHVSFTRESPREARLFGCFEDRAALVPLGRRRS
jgi:nitrogenase-stabilizing/protective protein